MIAWFSTTFGHPLHMPTCSASSDCCPTRISRAILTGLEALADAHADGEWDISLEDEDVHTALEKRLTDDIGEAGKRIHLGRSRNDQVLAALRLYLLDAADAMEDCGRQGRRHTRIARSARSGHTVARLYAYATGDAQFRRTNGLTGSPRNCATMRAA